jgi:hypothetical protein
MLVKEIASFDPEAPETIESQGKDEVKNSSELAQISLPPLILQSRMEGRRENAKRT